jgi:hypothetical protein
MKRILLIILLLPFFANAQFVNIYESQKVATQFLKMRHIQNPAKAPAEVFFTDTETSQVNGVPAFYIHYFNDSGFIIVSADKRVMPVLGYGYQSAGSENTKPEALKSWLKTCKQGIEHLRDNDLSPKPGIDAWWDNLLKGEFSTKDYRSLEPMLTTTWNQNRYYNSMCPEDPDGPDGRCYAGCVATAMGQLMNYYRWPQTGTGSYSYLHPEYGTLSANYENTTYLWDAMEDILTNYNLAVAELLYHAGVGVDMQYGPGGSGMYNHSAAYVLRTYFKYVPETQYIFRDSTTLDWDSIVLSNLNHQRPMYYAGWTSDTTIGIYGHAFVCDGYETEDYFHFNWGWGGSYDGYFYLDDLTPGSNFNYGQEVITNMYPDTNLYEYPYTLPECNHINYMNGTLTDGSGPEDHDSNIVNEWILAPGNENYDSITSITISFSQFELAEDAAVQIYDGGNNSAPLLGEFSGTTMPPAVTTSGDSAYIYFTTGALQAPGWKLSYSTNLPVYCSGMTSITEENGIVSDGSAEKLYTGNDLCRYWIKDVGGWDNLFLHFNYIELADENDRIEILDPATNQTIENFTGPISLTDVDVNAGTNQAFILFVTNGLYNADGFEASFQRSMVGINEEDEKSGLSIYPQPATNDISIEVPAAAGNIEQIDLIDITGALTSFNFEATQQNVTLSVSNLKAGIYLIRVTGSKKEITGKLLIR